MLVEFYNSKKHRVFLIFCTSLICQGRDITVQREAATFTLGFQDVWSMESGPDCNTHKYMIYLTMDERQIQALAAQIKSIKEFTLFKFK